MSGAVPPKRSSGGFSRQQPPPTSYTPPSASHARRTSNTSNVNLNRSRRPSNSAMQARPQAPATRGTVSGMRPNPAVCLTEDAACSEAAAYMAAKRQDAVLIVDSDGRLSGILTDKDLTYRVVAEGRDPKSTPVSVVMTANPVSVISSGDALEALNKMVAGHFRHLPVVESDDDDSDDGLGGSREGDSSQGGGGGGVVGVLDITKCLYEALEKLDRAQASSKQRLKEAIGQNSTAASKYAEELRAQLAFPDLAGLLGSEEGAAAASPPTVLMKATVLEAAKEMKTHKETAVLVLEEETSTPRGAVGGGLAGIFTSKDLVLRVLAAGLDPAITSVIRVMTPHPDCVTLDTPVVDALRKMHAGRYLHLPVVDEEGVVEGMVDVLKLTYATLSQMISTPTTNNSGGPIWDRFWDSALYSASASEPSELSVSDTTSNVSASRRNSHSTPYIESSSSSHHHHRRRSSQVLPPPMSPTYSNYSDIRDDSTVAPDDSASMFTGNTSDLGNRSAGGDTFVFKFRDEETGKVHRFTSSVRDLGGVRRVVREKCLGGGRGGAVGTTTAVGGEVQISYVDDEGDFVQLGTDRDLEDAVLMARASGWKRLLLSLDEQRRRGGVVGSERRGQPPSDVVLPGLRREAGVGSSSGSLVSLGGGGGPGTGPGSVVSTSTVVEPKRGEAVGELGVYGGGGGVMRNVQEGGGMSNRLIGPVLVGSGIALVCAFLLGRSFR
ncbi:hypothetical protein HDV00_007769 [Rhizophlyctis rosea]|nr:hypothetical protein HDV00_007769 [Rhizophlyctis rosea]